MNDESVGQGGTDSTQGPERMLRELEATIASQIDARHARATGLAAAGGLGTGATRGRLVGAVSLAAPERSTILLVHTALAAARMLRRPVLLLDLTDSVAFPSHARELPGLADLIAQPGLLVHHDSFARALGAHVGIARRGAGEEPSAAAIMDLLTELTTRYALVIVHSTPGAAARAALAQIADAGIAIGLDGETAMLRRARLPGERAVIALSDRTTSATEGERRALAEACRASVLAIVPGETIPLVREETATGGDAALWRTVDRIARHLLQRTVGVALGAGASGVFAHLGALAALDELGVTIDYLAASGAAAPIAVGAALGADAGDLRARLEETFHLLARPRAPWAAPGDDAALRATFDALAGGRSFADLDTSLTLIATDLDRAETVRLSEGALADATLASMALPGIIAPVEIDGRRLIDGGTLDPVPADALAPAGADVVIAVQIAPAPARLALDGGWRSRLRQPAVESVVRAFDLMQARIAALAGSAADLTITPEIAGATGLRDWNRADELIAAGRLAADAVSARLRARLAIADATIPERLAA